MEDKFEKRAKVLLESLQHYSMNTMGSSVEYDVEVVAEALAEVDREGYNRGMNDATTIVSLKRGDK